MRRRRSGREGIFTEHFATREEQRERKPEEGRESLGTDTPVWSRDGGRNWAGSAEVQEPAGCPRAAFPVMAWAVDEMLGAPALAFLTLFFD